MYLASILGQYETFDRITTSILKLFTVTNAAIGAVTQTVILPIPEGPYGVNITAMELTDTSRANPWAVAPRYRSIMVSGLYPSSPANCCDWQTTNYMPAKTAEFVDAEFAQYGVPPGTFESLKLPICLGSNDSNRQVQPQQYPLALFSPGYGAGRLLYSTIAEALTSYGYAVVMIDHPYDADVVEFPDGSTIVGIGGSSEEEILKAIEVRSADVSFVLDQLQDDTIRSELFPSFPGTFDLNRTLIFGHSLGGATAAQAMVNDSRLLAGVNLDGPFWGDLMYNSTKCLLDRPFLFFGRDGNVLPSTRTWETAWDNMCGAKVELEVLNTAHGSFGDFPVLIDALGFRDFLPPAAIDLIGNARGARMLEILTTYIDSFFRYEWAKEKVVPKVLRQNVTRFPEVQVLNVSGFD